MSFVLSLEHITAIKAHALAEYPNEACGLIVDGEYMPCVNMATDPTKDFVIPAALQVTLRGLGKTIQMVIHSHPGGPRFPTATDMRSQIDSGVPWGLVATDGEIVSPVETWGFRDVPCPIIGREFMHGIRDCYSLVRDVYRLGKYRLADQGIQWPLESISIPDFAREDNWWGDARRPGETLYIDNFEKQGFVRIPLSEAKPGDGFLMKIRSQTLNHAGVLCSDGMILHHLPQRLSRREPAAIWGRAADVWVRYEGKSSAS